MFTIFSVSFFKIVSPDFWWHIDYGRYFLQNGFPKFDPFSFALPGKPYFQSFLSDIILYIIYLISGAIGIFLLKILVLFLIFYIIRKKLNLHYLVFPLILLLISIRIFAKPEIFSLFFFTFSYYIFTKLSGKKRFIYLFFTTLVWNQLHQGVLLLLFFPLSILISELIFEKKFDKNRIFELIIIIIALLLNPSSFRNIEQYLNSFINKDFTVMIGEWLPLFSNVRPLPTFVKILFLFFGMIFLFQIIFHFDKKDRTIILPLFLGIAVLFARRFIPFFGISLIFVIDRFLKNATKIKRYGLIIMLIILYTINIFSPYYRLNVDPGIGISKFYDGKIGSLFYELNFLITLMSHRAIRSKRSLKNIILK
jgi:hypothetical protein